MSDFHAIELDRYLAELFAHEFWRVLEAEGFRESLRIPEPVVIEYQKGSDVLVIRILRVDSHRQSVEVESESIDVLPLIRMAAVNVIVEVSTQMFDSFPPAERRAVQQALKTCISDLTA